MADQTSHASQEQATRIMIASTALNAVLAAVQAAAGFTAHSSGLMADALHALTDVGVDLILLAVCWLCRPGRPAHLRRYAGFAQNAAPAGVGVMLVAAGIEIALFAQGRQPLAGPATMLALGVAACSVISRGLLYRALRRKARHVDSPVLSAAAWHVGADALSSVVAMAGIATAALGHPGVDSIAAALIGSVIAFGGARLIAQSAASLLRVLPKPPAAGFAGLRAEPAAAIARFRARFRP
jgi:cobalt-zinc-cadmium efflux system protein